MGLGIETVPAILTNAAATGAQAMTAGSGQSFTVRATTPGSELPKIVTISGEFQDAGEVRVRSPRMHDDVNAIRTQAQPSNFDNTFGEYYTQDVYPTDALIVEAFFTDIATVNHISVAYLTFLYPDVGGVNARLRTWAEVSPQIKNILAVPNDGTASATAGQWGASAAINSVVDVFKANTDYALLGYVAPVAFGAWSIQGVDVGNLQMGGPGTNFPGRTKDYFIRLGNRLGRPCIPIINSQNKGTTNVFFSDLGVSTAIDFTLIWAELAA